MRSTLATVTEVLLPSVTVAGSFGDEAAVVDATGAVVVLAVAFTATVADAPVVAELEELLVLPHAATTPTAITAPMNRGRRRGLRCSVVVMGR